MICILPSDPIILVFPLKPLNYGGEYMKKLINEFKDFIMRGNVLDMAVGVIIATSFGAITSSLVGDVFMPFISWLFGTRDMSALNILVRPEVVENGEVVQEAIVIGFGTFIATVIDFILVALVVFALWPTYPYDA